jgi:ERF superfamily
MSLIKSESIGKLMTALALAKAAFSPVLKLNENPGFKRNGKASKYADLATAIEATEGPLLANGIVVSQFPVNDGERVGALTLLTHSSGEYMGEAFTLPLGQQNAQTGVAAVTYARRTAYLAALGIATEDDDGNTASGHDNTESYSLPGGSSCGPRMVLPQTSPFREVAEATAYHPTPASKANTAPKVQKPTEIVLPTQEAPEHGDAWEGPEVSALPTETEMAAYRERFTQLANELSAHGKLTASKGLKLNTKLLTFLLTITKADAAKNISSRQWDNFFDRTSAAIANPEVGLIGLTKLINKANGIEDKK